MGKEYLRYYGKKIVYLKYEMYSQDIRLNHCILLHKVYNFNRNKH